MKFDIIGDVHGQYGKLIGLLRHLGYAPDAQGDWRHLSRTAIFVGDLIDRGPGQVQTVNLVRRMVSSGAARCVMGNHEFNAIAWHTPDLEAPGKYLRDHEVPGNREQHRAFLEEVEGKPAHAAVIDWFKTLPLWLDLGALRVVHACWQAESIERLQSTFGGALLTDALLVAASRKGHWAYQAIENILKGPSAELPPGVTFEDMDGKRRHAVRLRWWQTQFTTYQRSAIGPADEISRIPDVAIPAGYEQRPYEGAPVLFGHYWFHGVPDILSPRLACVDFSAASDGPLVAYRWDGEAALSADKLAWENQPDPDT